eukprot:g934.t1
MSNLVPIKATTDAKAAAATETWIAEEEPRLNPLRVYVLTADQAKLRDPVLTPDKWGLKLMKVLAPRKPLLDDDEPPQDFLGMTWASPEEATRGGARILATKWSSRAREGQDPQRFRYGPPGQGAEPRVKKEYEDSVGEVLAEVEKMKERLHEETTELETPQEVLSRNGLPLLFVSDASKREAYQRGFAADPLRLLCWQTGGEMANARTTTAGKSGNREDVEQAGAQVVRDCDGLFDADRVVSVSTPEKVKKGWRQLLADLGMSKSRAQKKGETLAPGQLLERIANRMYKEESVVRSIEKGLMFVAKKTAIGVLASYLAPVYAGYASGVIAAQIPHQESVALALKVVTTVHKRLKHAGVAGEMTKAVGDTRLALRGGALFMQVPWLGPMVANHVFAEGMDNFARAAAGPITGMLAKGAQGFASVTFPVDDSMLKSLRTVVYYHDYSGDHASTQSTSSATELVEEEVDGGTKESTGHARSEKENSALEKEAVLAKQSPVSALALAYLNKDSTEALAVRLGAMFEYVAASAYRHADAVAGEDMEAKEKLREQIESVAYQQRAQEKRPRFFYKRQQPLWDVVNRLEIAKAKELEMMMTPGIRGEQLGLISWLPRMLGFRPPETTDVLDSLLPVDLFGHDDEVGRLFRQHVFEKIVAGMNERIVTITKVSMDPDDLNPVRKSKFCTKREVCADFRDKWVPISVLNAYHEYALERRKEFEAVCDETAEVLRIAVQDSGRETLSGIATRVYLGVNFGKS